MNLKEEKENLISEFNRNQQVLAQLQARQQQILGQINLIERLEQENSKEENKENKENKEDKENKENKENKEEKENKK